MDVAFTQAQRDALMIGLGLPDPMNNDEVTTGLIGWAQRLDEHGLLGQLLPVTGMSLGQATDFGRVLNERFRVPIANYFQIDLTPTTGELVTVLQNLGGSFPGGLSLSIDPGVKGGLCGSEITFTLGMHADRSISGRPSLGPNGEILGVTFDPTFNFVADFDFLFTFGIALNSKGVPVSDPFFVRNVSLEAHTSGSTGTPLSGGMNLGFLDATMSSGTFSLSGTGATVTLNDPDGTVTGNQLNNTPLATLVSLTAMNGTASATVNVSAPALGNFPGATGTVSISTTTPFTAPQVVFSSGLDEVKNFTNINSSGLIGVIGQLASHFGSLGLKALASPLHLAGKTAKLEKLLKLDKMVSKKLVEALTDPITGMLNFDSTQTFVSAVQALPPPGTVTVIPFYDTATDDLTYTFTIQHSFESITEPFGVQFDLGPLVSLQSTSTVGANGSGTLNMKLGVNLSGLVATLTAKNDGPANGQLVSGDAVFTLKVGPGATPVTVTVTKASTLDNSNLDDLVADINAALTSAGLGTSVSAGRSNQRLTLTTRGDSVIAELTFNAAKGDPSRTEFGFADGQRAIDTLSKHSYVENVSATLSGSVGAPDVDATARLGFLRLDLVNGSGSATAAVNFQLRNPTTGTPGGRVTFPQFVEVLNNATLYPNPVGTLVTGPNLGGSLNLNLPLRVSGDILGVLPGSPTVSVSWPDVTIGSPQLTFTDAQPILNFQNLNAGTIINALINLASYLASLQSNSSLLDKELPVLNRSIGEIISFAEDFAARAATYQSNPAQALQDLESFLEEAFNLGDPQLELTLQENATVVRVDLDLGRTLSTSLPMNFDLSGLNVPGVGNLLDFRGDGLLSVSAGVNLNLDFGLDVSQPANPRAFLYDTTTAQLAARVTGTNINFSAALGPLGMFVQGATVNVDGDGNPATTSDRATLTLGLNDLDNDGKIYLSNLSLSNASVTVAGQAHATVPLFFPVKTTSIGNLTLTIPDLGNIPSNPITAPDFSSIFGNFAFLSDLGVLLSGLDFVLGKLADAIESQALGKRLPLVGDDLDEAANFIRSLREDVLARLAARFAAQPDSPAVARQALFDAFGPGGLRVLKDRNGDKLINIHDVGMTLTDLDNDGQADDKVDYDLRLGQNLALLSAPIGFDAGLKGLELEVDGNVQLQLGWDWKLAFGVQRDVGFYFNTAQADEVTIELVARIPDLTARGELFFLQLDVSDEDADTNPNNHGVDVDGDGVFPSSFGAMLRLNLVDPISGGAGLNQLTFTDIVNSTPAQIVQARIDGAADVNLDLLVSFRGDARFPSVAADFRLDWNFLNDSTFQGSLPTIAFNNVRLDVGEWVTDFAEEIARKVRRLTEPLDDIVEFLKTPLPLLSSVLNNATPLQLAEAFGFISADTRYFIEMADALITAINDVPEVDQNLFIPLGSFTVLGDPREAPGAGENSGLTPNPTQTLDPIQQMGTIPAAKQELRFYNRLKHLFDPDTDIGFKFPIIEKPPNGQPHEIFKALLGNDVTLFTFDVPDIRFALPFTYRFGPIFPPLPIFGTISGSLGVHTNIDIGFDTHGLRKYEQTRDTLDVFSGFYLVDHPGREASLEGSIRAGLQLNIVVAEAGIEGGITTSLGVDLVDFNADGKVHVDEFLENLDRGFLCTFEVSGEVKFDLVAYYKLLFSSRRERELANVTLIDFNLTDEDCFPDRFSGNNSFASARFLGVGPGLHVDWLAIQNSDLVGGQRQDWFKFELLRPDSVDVDVRYTYARGNIDVQVYDAAQMPIGQNLTNPSHKLDRDIVRLSNVPAGTYYIRVLGTQQNEYKLGIEPAPASATRVIYVNPANADPEHPNSYYTFRPGKDINDGLDYTHPKATLQSVFDTYDLGPNDLIVFDTGLHNSPATLTASDQGATYVSSVGGGYVSNLVVNDSDNNLFYRMKFGGSGTGLRIAGDGKNDAVNNIVRKSEIQNVPIGVRVDSTRYTLIENNTSSGSGTTGLHISHNAAPVVRFNDITGRQVGIYTASKLAQIYGNTVHGNTTGIVADGGVVGPSNLPPVEGGDLPRNDVFGNATGIHIPPTSTGAIVRFNTVRNNTTVGIEARADNSSVVANLVHGNAVGIRGDDLVGPQSWESNLFNVIRNNTTGMWANAGAEFRFNKVHNNATGVRMDGGLVHHTLVYRNTARGFQVDGARNAQIISNTVFAHSGDGVHLRNFSQNVTLRNNIIHVQNGYALRVDPDSEAYSSNSNNLFSSGGGKVAFQGKDFTDLYDWQTEAESDINSIGRTSLAPTLDDPLFVNTAADDYRLQAGSTSIDAGDPASPFSQEPAPNGGRIDLGAYGNTSGAGTSQPAWIEITYPDFYADLDRTRSYTIRWNTFNITGNLRIELVQVVGGSTVTQLFASVPASAGSQNWTPSASGIAGNLTHRYRIRLTSLSNPSIVEESREPFAIVAIGASQSYFVDDSSNANDEFTPAAVGSNRNTGTAATQPKASLRGLLLSYPLTSTNTVNIDTGEYVHAIDNNLRGAASAAEPRIQTVNGATIRGPTLTSRVAKIDRVNPFNGATTIHLIGSDNIKIRDLTLVGAHNGLHASDDSDLLQATNLKISGHARDGLLIEGSSDNATLTNLTVFSNNRHGIFVDSLLTSLTGSEIYENEAIGVALRRVGAAIVQNNKVHHNGNKPNKPKASGIDIINPGAAQALIGEAGLAYLGNLVYSNGTDGVFASGNVLVGGNTLYANGARGIRLNDGADAVRNIVRGNQTGISAFGSTSNMIENRVYAHPMTGIEASYGSNIVRNIVYSNGLYGIHTKNFSGLVDHNIVYSTESVSINVEGPGRGGRLINNTVYEPCDDNLDPLEQCNIRFGWDWILFLQRDPQPHSSTSFFSNGIADPTSAALNPRSLSKSGVAAPANSFWSEVQNPAGDLSQSNSVAGFAGHQVTGGGAVGQFRLADDFTIPQGQLWRLDAVNVYAYQTGFGGSSPLVGANLRIWNGRPGDAGSFVVFGDTITNRLISSTQTNMFRVFNTVAPPPGTAPGTTRRLFEHKLGINTILPQGTYWLDWQLQPATPSAAQFVPSVTVEGQRTQPNANARQLINSAGIPQWIDVLDSGNPPAAPDLPQDFPFVMVGQVLPPGHVFSPPQSWSGPTWGHARVEFAQPRGVNNPANTFTLGPGGDATALTSQPVPPGDTFRIPFTVTQLDMNSVMSGVSPPGIGPVFMRMSQQRPSVGQIEVTNIGGQIAGNVVLDVFVEFVLPSQGITLQHLMPLTLRATFSGLDPFQSLQTVLVLQGQGFPGVSLYNPRQPSAGAWGRWGVFQTHNSPASQVPQRQDRGDTCAEIGIWIHNQATKVLLRNNIVYVEGDQNLAPPDNSHDIIVEADSTARWNSDFNLLTTRFGNIGRWAGTEAPTLTAWQSASGDDRHSTDQDIDLIFVDPDGSDGMLGAAGPGVNDGRDDNFHLKSPFGHVVIGANAPEEDLDGTSLPEFPGIVRDPMPFVPLISPAIDNGDPSYDYLLEPLDNGPATPLRSNGKWINQGAYGNTTQSLTGSFQESLSPTEFVHPVFPIGFETLVPGSTVELTWRTHDPPAPGVNIELLGTLTPTASPLPIALSVPDTGSYLWTVPSGLNPSDSYRIRISRTDETAAGETRFPFAIAADTVPPRVLDTDPDIVHESFTTNASVGSIRLYFSENLVSAAATSPGNYQLRGAGPNGIFDDADDILYSLGPTYTAADPGAGTAWPGTPTRPNVLLTITAGPLPQGLYRLTAFATPGIGLRDLANIPLDGDENGAPGGNYVRTFTIDFTAPTIDSIDRAPQTPRNLPVGSLTFSFSEPVQHFGLADIVLTRDGRHQLLSGDQSLMPDSTFMTWTLSGLTALTTPEGVYSLTVDAATAVILDLAGNPLGAGTSISWTMDTTAPKADILNVVPNPRTGAISSITIVATEQINGLNLSKLSLTRNGGANLLTSAQTLTTSDNITFTLNNLGGLTATEGTYLLSLSAAGISDLATNALAGDAHEAFEVITSAPTASIAAVAPDPRNSPVSSITINMSQLVSGFDLSDLSLTRNAGPNLLTGAQALTTDDGVSYTLTNLQSITALAGNYVLTLAAAGSGIVNAAGIALTANATESWLVDTTAPTADIIDVSPDPRTTGVGSIVIVFSEPILGFDISDLSLSRNGGANLLTSAQTLTTSDNLTFTLGNLPAITFPQGSYTLTLNAASAGITDAAGNALAGSASDSFTVTVTSVPATALDDHFFVRMLGLDTILIWHNTSTNGAPTHALDLAATTQLIFDTGSGNDSLTIDATLGSPIPSLGISYVGGTQTSADALSVIGGGLSGSYTPSGTTPGNGNVTMGARTITFSGLEPLVISDFDTFSLITPNADDVLAIDSPAPLQNRISGTSGGVAFEAMTFFDVADLLVDAGANDGAGADDSLTIQSSGLLASGLNSFRFKGGAGNDSLTVNGGSLSFAADAATDTANLTLNVNTDATGTASVIFNATQHLAGLNLGSGGSAVLSSGGARVLVTKSLGISGTGKLDLTNHGMIIDYSGPSPLTAVRALLASGYNGGAWNGNGINSSTAAALTSTALGFAEASNLFSNFPASFLGESVDSTAVLIRHVRYGDADLSGNVNLNDFNRLAGSFGGSGTIWSSGDFNYDTFTNLNDFNLLAGNFGLTTGSLPDAVVQRRELTRLRQSIVGGLTALPARFVPRIIDSLDDLLGQSAPPDTNSARG